jgi:hypothetical protein
MFLGVYYSDKRRRCCDFAALLFGKSRKVSKQKQQKATDINLKLQPSSFKTLFLCRWVIHHLT